MSDCDLCGKPGAMRVRGELLCPRCQKIDADARRAEADER